MVAFLDTSAALFRQNQLEMEDGIFLLIFKALCKEVHVCSPAKHCFGIRGKPRLYHLSCRDYVIIASPERFLCIWHRAEHFNTYDGILTTGS